MKKGFFCFIVTMAVLSLVLSCACPPDPLETPEAQIGLSSEYFDPNEGPLTITLPDLTGFPIVSWKVEVFEPLAPDMLFHEWTWSGQPPRQITWDGKNSQGQLVYAASEYPLVYTAQNRAGNNRIITSSITVDAFTVRDGASLRITVPSIIFAPNVDNWNGLDPDIIANNEWIISRLALALEYHGEYSVKVEGHANYTVNPNNTPGRQYEQTYELLPLSRNRARTVVNELVKLGVASGRLSYDGIGGAHPLAAWEDHDNWWKNRRVEFILTY